VSPSTQKTVQIFFPFSSNEERARKRKMNKSESSNRGLKEEEKQITTADSCILLLIQRLVDCLRPPEQVVLLTLPCVLGGDGIDE